MLHEFQIVSCSQRLASGGGKVGENEVTWRTFPWLIRLTTSWPQTEYFMRGKSGWAAAQCLAWHVIALRGLSENWRPLFNLIISLKERSFKYSFHEGRFEPPIANGLQLWKVARYQIIVVWIDSRFWPDWDAVLAIEPRHELATSLLRRKNQREEASIQIKYASLIFFLSESTKKW